MWCQGSTWMALLPKKIPHIHSETSAILQSGINKKSIVQQIGRKQQTIRHETNPAIIKKSRRIHGHRTKRTLNPRRVLQIEERKSGDGRRRKKNQTRHP